MDGGFVAGVVLAAGLSRRFAGEGAKQLLPFQGEPLVRRIARQALASRLQEVTVVLGWCATQVKEALDGLPVQWVENPHFPEGQSTSVKAGLRAVARRADAVLFMPVDQPYLTSTLIDGILATYRATGGPIVLPCFQGQRGAPVLFERTLFAEIESITGDEGARQILRRHPRKVVTLELESGLPLRDINTLGDFKDLRPLRPSP